MSDPVARLNAALEGCYSIERDLCTESFLAEIKMTASLQHPHIMRAGVRVLEMLYGQIWPARGPARLDDASGLPIYPEGSLAASEAWTRTSVTPGTLLLRRRSIPSLRVMEMGQTSQTPRRRSSTTPSASSKPRNSRSPPSAHSAGRIDSRTSLILASAVFGMRLRPVPRCLELRKPTDISLQEATNGLASVQCFLRACKGGKITSWW